MSKEFTIEEKIYNKLLLLHANDNFMADVSALEEKCAKLTKIKKVGKSEILIQYQNSSEYNEEITNLRKKYKLSSIYHQHLKSFVPHGGLPIIHGSTFNFLGHPIPKILSKLKNKSKELRVVIEIFPETTLNDFVNNWDKISKKRDELFGIKKDKEERFARNKNLERDIRICYLEKEGKTCMEITKEINETEEFKNNKTSYQDISKIIKRIKDKANNLTPTKKT